MIGPENSHHSLNQSYVKLKPISSLSPGLALEVFSFLLTGRLDNFGFGFTTLNGKAL